jgi:transposase
MMGRQNNDQGPLFYEFWLDEAVPDDHLVRKIDAVLDLSWVYAELAPHYPTLGRPSVDPVLMIRMLIVGYVFGLRSDRLLCREVQVNLAYRWFCKLGIEHKIPDHSAFSRARNERFRGSDIFRRVFEWVVEACIAAGLVGGEGFAVDASLIAADANKQRSVPGKDWDKNRAPEKASRAVKEYLATLDDAAFGAASDVTPKFVSPSDPAAQWTGAMRAPAFFAYSETLHYRASTPDCRGFLFKAQCCPKAPFRRIPRSIYEEARDFARALDKTKAFEQSCRERKRIEMLFAHLKRILRLGRLRLRPARLPVRVHAGSYRPEPSSARQTDCTTATGSRCMSRVTNA